ncbi:CLUMA_CG016931, isoform A [Clunio marinus]|uniref:CLUMA_CG016931, isoform A n=1 Tax=Clunio marinus TaxID=568069 RepID=A0A1J1IS94_9DIPT|nr:CLUMA_CG016931, isoform A [Clunio marinus]
MQFSSLAQPCASFLAKSTIKKFSEPHQLAAIVNAQTFTRNAQLRCFMLTPNKRAKLPTNII